MSAAVKNPLPARSQLDKILKAKPRNDVEEEDLKVWDKGVFMNELLRAGIALETNKEGALKGGLVANAGIQKGTFKGTQLAITEIYKIIEEAAASHFDTKGYEPIFPTERDLETKQKIYQWSDGSDGYPPHLSELPPDEQQSNTDPNTDREKGVGQIFDVQKAVFVNIIARALGFIIPKEIEAQGTPFYGPTLADCEKWNKENRSAPTDIMDGRNIGEHDDWYSDARFAQQHLSGVNPSTIEKAPKGRIQEYIAEAGKQGLDGIKKILSDGKDLLIQDYAYFRDAGELGPNEEFVNVIPEIRADGTLGDKAFRYACAPIVIFQLHGDGRLHPLAITLDYKGSLDKSVTLFNKRLTPNDKGDEKNDWPWRYAKTCAQTADWARHEIATHLVDTHMIEEAIIVATNRTIPEGHLLYEILSPHWFRTLALNSAARTLLVPAVINRIAGFGPSWNPLDPQPATSRAFKVVRASYKAFNFQDKYIPNDLKKRGFDLEAEGAYEKYRNYPYAYDMYLLWGVIREFVKTVIDTKYKCDADVQKDKYIGPWCKEIQSDKGGQVPTFPTIKTVDQLIDAVTMCIHTASPQHTAVNYLQDYYYSFVPSKPPALCTPLPKDLKSLQGYTEKHLTEALPIGTEGPKWKDWLLAAQLPELLSFKVDDRYNLLTYAKSLYNVNKARNIEDNPEFDSYTIKEASKTLYSRLGDLSQIFQLISLSQTKGTIEYKVLEPSTTAISILI